MKKGRVPRRRGFTLVEILVAIALFSVFSLTLARLLMGGMYSYKHGQAFAALRSRAQDTLDLINADIRNAVSPDKVSQPVSTSSNQSLNLGLTRYEKGREGSGGVWGSLQYAARTPSTYDISYKIKKDGDVYVLENTEKNTTYIVVDNVMLGESFGSSGVAGSYSSYFRWCKEFGSNTSAVPRQVLESRIRLGRYVNQDLVTVALHSYCAVQNTPTTQWENNGNMRTVGTTRTIATKPALTRTLRSGRLSF